MKKKININQRVIEYLENIAMLVFPMEIEARIPIIEVDSENGERLGMDVQLPYEYGDPRAYQYSDNFKELIRCLRNNNIPNFTIKQFLKERGEAKKMFRQYKKCQRKRKTGKCDIETKDIVECSKRKCKTGGQPVRKYMYDWFPESPSVAWHSHVTSKYGDLEKLSVPSGNDNYILAKRIYFKGLPIEAEMITCTCENGRQKTRLFYPPTKSFFKKPEQEREEMKID